MSLRLLTNRQTRCHAQHADVSEAHSYPVIFIKLLNTMFINLFTKIMINKLAISNDCFMVFIGQTNLSCTLLLNFNKQFIYQTFTNTHIKFQQYPSGVLAGLYLSG